MVIFINTVVFFIYLIAVIWSWKSLTNLSPLKKIIAILAGILIVYIITSILLNISKTNITYPTEEMGQKVTTVLTIVFTAINALIIPIMSKNIVKMQSGEIDIIQFKKKIIAIFLIGIVFLGLECGYLKNTQKEIVNIYYSKVEQN